MRTGRNLSRASLLLFVLGLSIGAFSLTFVRLAGSAGGPGSDDGTGAAAQFSGPSATAVDTAGNVYVADSGNHTIRRITPSGEVTTLAGLAETSGNADGKGAYARFYSPQGIAVDASGNVYVADAWNRTIRKITPAGIVTTVAGQAGSWGYVDATGSAARFGAPVAITVDAEANLYVADSDNSAIRKVTPAGVVSTVAGGSYGGANGVGTAAQFKSPRGLVFDAASNALYVADQYNNAVRRISLPGGTVTTFAGTIGSYGHADGSPGLMTYPKGITVDSTGTFFVADGNRIRSISPGGTLGTVAGSSGSGADDGSGTAARFTSPAGLAASGPALYVADTGNDSVRKVTLGSFAVVTFAGSSNLGGFVNGTGSAARFSSPAGIAYYPGPGITFVSDNNAIRKVTAGGVVTTLAGGTYGYANGSGAAAQFRDPRGLALRLSDLSVLVADTGNHCIRLVDASGNASLFAGQPGTSGSANGDRLTSAQFRLPQAVALNAGATALYVADTGNRLVRKIVLGTGVVSTLAGSGTTGTTDGPGVSASFGEISGITVDSAENVYVTESVNGKIRKITPDGTVSTFAGSGSFSGALDGVGTAARFGYPGPAGISGWFGASEAHVADSNAFLVRTLRLSDASVGTAGGKAGVRGLTDGTGPFARFLQPRAAASAGTTLALADGNSIRLGVAEIADRAVIDAGVTGVGTTRQLDTAPQSATSWSWSIVRRPTGSTATLSSATARNPVFTPDVDDLFVFRCVATSSAGTSISTVSLRAWAPPTATVSGGGASCGSGAPATITAALTGAAPWSITWSDGVTQSGLSSPIVSRSVSPASTTTYAVTSVSDANATGTSSGSATVTVATPPTATATGATICPGGTATLSAALTGTAPWTIVWADGVTQSGIATSPATRSVSPAATTTYAITSLSDASCTVPSSAVATVVVVPSSVTIAAPPYVCASSSGNAASVPDFGAGATYAWGVTNGTITAGAGTPSITFSSSGTGAVGLTVTVTSASCTASGSATLPLQQCGGATPGYVFTHFAGTPGGAGYFDGTGSAARFSVPNGAATDSAGNVYVADSSNHTIRKITPTGSVTTLAGLAGSSGSADGIGATARFSFPTGVATDSAGNVYVADSSNQTIRKVTPGGVVTTLAGQGGSFGSTDGSGSAARFFTPAGVAIDSVGNVYVADRNNHTIRKITPNGLVTTLAGLVGNAGSADGTGSGARFNYPQGVATDSAANLYVADWANHTIRKITPDGVVTTLAGQAGNSGIADGTGVAARFNYPRGLTTDSAGNVYVADSNSHTIRKITTAGVVTTLAGQGFISGSADGTGTTARFYYPAAVTTDTSGNIHVADSVNHTIRTIAPGGAVTTLAGQAGSMGSADGTGSVARFYYPNGVATDSVGNVYVADRYNQTIRKITPAGAVATLAGQAGIIGSADGTGSVARFYYPNGVSSDSSGNVYVADSANHTIRKVTAGGIVTTVAGAAGNSGSADGTGTAARFRYPYGVAVDSVGNIYVADQQNHTIRKITPGGVVTTLAGQAGSLGSADGAGSTARFTYPAGVVTDSAGNVYVADQNNQTIRKVTQGGVVTTVAGLAGSIGSADGTGSAARFYNPRGIAIDKVGNVYVADPNNHAIRRVSPAGVVTTLGGQTGSVGNSDGTGSAAKFNFPNGVAVDSAGNLYVADRDNNAIRIGRLAIPDVATIDSGTGPVGTSRQLDVAPQNATSWQWSVIRRPSGSTAELSSPSLRNPTFNPDVVGLFHFRVVASNAVGTSITIVSLQAWAPPTATVSGGGVSCGSGAPATITAALTGTAPWSITWSDGVTQSGLSSPIVSRSVSPGSTTTYTVTAVSDANASGTSSGSATVTVATPPTATATGETICPGGTATLSVALTGAAPWTIVWSDGVTQSGITASPATRTVSPAATTAYAITSFSDATCAVPGDSSAAVVVLPQSILMSAPAFACSSAASNRAGVIPFPPGATYSWSVTNGSITGGAGTNSITFTPSGTTPVGLTVTVTAGGSCAVSASASVPVQTCSTVPGYVFTTLAGAAGGAVDGPVLTARLDYPYDVAVDAAGNIYVGDTRNHVIRKITPAGLVTTLAGQAGLRGSADGQGAIARFSYPAGVASDAAGNVYVADRSNHTIRKITPAGEVSTFAGLAGTSGHIDATGTEARLNDPEGVATDAAGNIYVAEAAGCTIRKITPAGVVTTLAGQPGVRGSTDGTGAAALFDGPADVAVGASGDVYVADFSNSTIRRITPTGVVSTVAGTAGVYGSADGNGAAAQFQGTQGITVDNEGNLYVADYGNGSIRKVTPVGGVSTFAGLSESRGDVDGIGAAARFNVPNGVEMDPSGNLYVADAGNNKIRKITPAGVVTTVAGLASGVGNIDSTGALARFDTPSGLAMDGDGNVFVPDFRNSNVRKITPSGVVSTVGTLFLPWGATVDSAGSLLVTSYLNNQIYKRAGDSLIPFAGSGASGSADASGNAASFRRPRGLASDAAGNVYVADAGNHTIRKITSAGVVTTIAGLALSSGTADGSPNAARFNAPYGVAADAIGNVFVADTNNLTIRRITPAGLVTTLAGQAGVSGFADGSGSSARFSRPYGISVDPRGIVWVADGAAIRTISPDGMVTTVAGEPGRYGSADGTGPHARFNYMYALTVGRDGTVYAADSGNHTIRIGRMSLPDTATIDNSTGAVGAARQLDAAPQNATSYQWQLIRIPSGSSGGTLSSSTLRNPTFTPDAPGLYELRLTASNSIATSITTVALEAGTSTNATPAITAAQALSRTAGSAGSSSTVATVSDAEDAAGTLTVTATNVPAGITIAGITNTNGTVTATVTATCTATAGANSVTLRVQDSGGLSATATLTVNVTANPAPTLGTYPNTSVVNGGSVTVTPTAPPADNTTVAQVTVAASAGFTGTTVVNAATGVVTISNANTGTYTITVTVTDNCGSTVTRTFTLTASTMFAQTRIVFSSDRGPCCGPTPFQIYTVRPDGSELTRLTENPGQEEDPIWSPNGSQIAFSTNRETAGVGFYQIYLMNGDGSNQRRIVASPTVGDDLTGSFSPDGQKIAFSSNRANSNPQATVGPRDLYVMAVDGTNLVRLTTTSADERWPLFSPDGTRIAYGSHPGGTGHWEVFVMNADGTNPVQVTTSPNDAIPTGWSPDGTRIVYDMGLNRATTADVFTIRPDGTSKTQLTSGGGFGATYSPDGTKLAFVSSRFQEPPNSHLYVMDADGSNPTQITFTSSRKERARWSPLIGSNTLPSITAASAVARTAGSTGSNSTIASVTDAEDAAGTLSVTATNVPAGITIAGITNTNGTVTATVTATCTATAGANSVTLRVQDSGGLSATATLTVNVTANPAPTLGTYPNTSVANGGTVTVTPTAPPADNGSVTQVTVSASAGFTGTAGVNAATGAVTITNANTGLYTVTVTATDNCGGAVTRTFTLTVTAALTVSSVSPMVGTTAGGTSVTITGTGFATGAGVTFGGTAATNVVVVSSTAITATTPAHASGAVNVVVTNPDNQSAQLANGFVYAISSGSTVTAGAGIVCAGGTVIIPVNLTGSVAPLGLQFDVTFDPQKLTVTSVTAGSLTNGFSISSNPSTGRIRIAMASGTPAASGNGEVARITFQGAAGMTSGTTSTIGLDNGLLNDQLVNQASGSVMCCRRGDVNGNGQISALDASMILQIAVGLITPTPLQFCSADVNGNGAVTALDAAELLRCIVGLGTCPQ